MDELASFVGCAPNIAKLLITDTWLALSLWFGPYYPYVFRLNGPNSWDGARDAILNAEIRKRCGMLGVNQLNKSLKKNKWLKILILIIGLSLIFGLFIFIKFF